MNLIEPNRVVDLFSPGSPEASAAATLLKKHNQACSRVAKTSYRDLLTELRKFDDMDEDSYSLLSEKDRDRVLKAAYRVEGYSLDHEELTDAYLSLVALWALGKDLRRNDLLEFLDGQSWGVKHEVLTRWGWMQKHREILEEAAHPFLCHVAGRGKGGRRADKEFYQLLRFLHALREVTGEELLFLEKGETPDFVLEDAAGGRVGAEMSEVPLSKVWADEQDAEAKVLNVFRAHLKERGLILRVCEPKSWRTLVSQLGDLDAWFSAEIGQIEPSRKWMTLHAGFGLEMEVKSSSNPGIVTSARESQGRAEMEQEVRLLADSIYDRVKAKIRKKTKAGSLKPAKVPSVRPCHLVLYPNCSLGHRVEQAAEIFAEKVDFDVSTYFEAVWLSKENMIQRIWPA